MWLAVAVCLLAASTSPSITCRPPQPDTEHITVAEGSGARLPCRLDARRAATSWARLDRNRSRLLTITINAFAHAASDRFRLVRAHRPWPHWQLLIENVTAADAGLYRCYALYERAVRAGEPPGADASRRLRLTVVPAAGARLAGPSRRRLSTGTQLTLSCAGHPPLSWSVDGRPVAAGGRVAVSAGPACSRLQVDNVTAADGGLYACHAPGLEADSVHVEVAAETAWPAGPRGSDSAAHAAYISVLLVILGLFVTAIARTVGRIPPCDDENSF